MSQGKRTYRARTFQGRTYQSATWAGVSAELERATQIDDETAWTAQQRVAEFVSRSRPTEWTAPERVA